MARPRATNGGGGGGSADEQTDESDNRSTKPESPKTNREAFRRAGEAAEAGAPVEDAELKPAANERTDETAQISTEQVDAESNESPDRVGDNRLDAPSGGETGGGGGDSGSSSGGSGDASGGGSSDPVGDYQPDGTTSTGDGDGNDRTGGLGGDGGGSGTDSGPGGGSEDPVRDYQPGDSAESPSGGGDNGGDGGGSGGGSSEPDGSDPVSSGPVQNPDGTTSTGGEESPEFDPRPDSYDDPSDVGSSGDSDGGGPGGDGSVPPASDDSDSSPDDQMPEINTDPVGHLDDEERERAREVARTVAAENEGLDPGDVRLTAISGGGFDVEGVTEEGRRDMARHSIAEQNEDIDPNDLVVSETDDGGFTGELTAEASREAEAEMIKQAYRERGAEFVAVGFEDGEPVVDVDWGDQPDEAETPDGEMTMTSGEGDGPEVGSEQFEEGYVEAQMERGTGRDVDVEQQDDGSFEVEDDSSDRYGGRRAATAGQVGENIVEEELESEENVADAEVGRGANDEFVADMEMEGASDSSDRYGGRRAATGGQMGEEIVEDELEAESTISDAEVGRGENDEFVADVDRTVAGNEVVREVEADDGDEPVVSDSQDDDGGGGLLDGAAETLQKARSLDREIRSEFHQTRSDARDAFFDLVGTEEARETVQKQQREGRQQTAAAVSTTVSTTVNSYNSFQDAQEEVDEDTVGKPLPIFSSVGPGKAAKVAASARGYLNALRGVQRGTIRGASTGSRGASGGSSVARHGEWVVQGVDRVVDGVRAAGATGVAAGAVQSRSQTEVEVPENPEDVGEPTEVETPETPGETLDEVPVSGQRRVHRSEIGIPEDVDDSEIEIRGPEDARITEDGEIELPADASQVVVKGKLKEGEEEEDEEEESEEDDEEEDEVVVEVPEEFVPDDEVVIGEEGTDSGQEDATTDETQEQDPLVEEEPTQIEGDEFADPDETEASAEEPVIVDESPEQIQGDEFAEPDGMVVDEGEPSEMVGDEEMVVEDDMVEMDDQLPVADEYVDDAGRSGTGASPGLDVDDQTGQDQTPELSEDTGESVDVDVTDTQASTILNMDASKLGQSPMTEFRPDWTESPWQMEGTPSMTEPSSGYSGTPTEDRPGESPPGYPGAPGSPGGGLGRPRKPPGPQGDELELDLGGGIGFRANLGATSGPLTSGWVAETVTSMATMGGPRRPASRSALEARADETWELPTRAMVSGSERTQERIAAVAGLLGGFSAVEETGGDGGEGYEMDLSGGWV